MTTQAILSGSYENYKPYERYDPTASREDTLQKNASMRGIPGETKEADRKPKINFGEDDIKAPGRKSSPAECQTCKNRKYQDGSDEMVSFKSAAHISPQASASRVRAHEQEHVSNAYKKAYMNNGKVVSATVSIHTAVCPECGRTYVSGGETNTQIRYFNEENPYQKAKKTADSTIYAGRNINAAV